MGIYIHGMEMPTDGEMLCINIYPSGTVCINLDVKCKRVANAVQVPPHGRTIDADALKAMWDDEISRMLEKGVEYLDYHVETLLSDCKREVDKMPTIIPASGGQEDE